MNVLIVDDNKNNRMILRLLLEDYVEENPSVSLIIDEAEDGLQAVSKCESSSYDMVLMDIMMPNMDGIEATRLIRQKDKKVMIIAVSAVDEIERKKLILTNGAEDYISKPVNADIFISRFSNYITLIEARRHKKRNTQTINLFTNEIFNRHIKFFVTSEDSIAEFWEYFLLEAEHKCDNLSDLVRAVVSIAEAQIRLGAQCEIYIEDSEEFKYFTITNIDVLPQKVLMLILKRNDPQSEYKENGTKLSLALPKIYSTEEIVAEPVAVVEPVISAVAEPEVFEEEIASPLEIMQSSELHVLDYIEGEDLYDLEDYAGKLNSLMLVVGSGDVTEEEVVEIYSYLERLGSILATYSEVYPISKALSELSYDMSTHMQEFTENSEALGPMCRAFSNDMRKWIEMSFHTGAPSADFMNDTIVVNCQTIGGMLKMNDEVAGGGDELDDIFDF